MERNFFLPGNIFKRGGVKIKEKIKVKACPKGQLITSLERLLNEIRKGYLAMGDARVDLPKTVDLKMELEEKNSRVEFELELNWPLHPGEEAETGEAVKTEEKNREGKEEEAEKKEKKEEAGKTSGDPPEAEEIPQTPGETTNGR